MTLSDSDLRALLAMEEKATPGERFDSRAIPDPANDAGRFNFGFELARRGMPYPDEDWWFEHTTCNVYDEQEAQLTMWTEDACQGWLWFHSDELLASRNALREIVEELLERRRFLRPIPVEPLEDIE